MLRSPEGASRSTHTSNAAETRKRHHRSIPQRCPDFCPSYGAILTLRQAQHEGLGVNMARKTKGRGRRLSTHPPKPAAPALARTTANLWLWLRCAVLVSKSTDVPPTNPIDRTFAANAAPYSGNSETLRLTSQHRLDERHHVVELSRVPGGALDQQGPLDGAEGELGRLAG